LFLGKVQLIDRITGVRAKLRHKIEATAIEVLELSQVGLAVKAFGARSEVNDIQTSSLTSMDATGKFKAKVSLNSLDANSEVSVGASDERKTQASKAVHEEVAILPRFTLVKKKILELLHLMEIRHLNLLIDEWQTLDPHCSTGIQSGFAEYLKRTFAGAPEISVKIATNRYQTRFNNKGKGTGFRYLHLSFI
jgi:hypothetical protein